MKNLLFLLLFIGSNLANGQNLTSTSYLFKANQWLQMKDYANAAEAFAKGFQLNGGMAIPKDRYNAAVAFAHLYNADTVIHYINRLAIRIKYDDIEKIEQEEAFRFLDNNEKWMEVCAQIKKNGEQYNRPVMKKTKKYTIVITMQILELLIL